MDHALKQLGLNSKEAAFYLFLLKEGSKTGAQLAKELKENRTNTYMILNRLAENGLVTFHNSSVRRYLATNPENLKKLIVNRQQQIRQAQGSLNNVLPELKSLFNLNQHKPGVVYLEGLSGFAAFQEDLANAKSTVSVFASSTAPDNHDAWETLQSTAKKRAQHGTQVNILFRTAAKPSLNINAFQANGYNVRFWGELPMEGETAIYDNKVGITAYQPRLITTVITNEVIARTFRALFDQLWEKATV